nr:Ergosterol biosynthesis ERG4 ERG24 domain containing protein [Haemonchus contortus]
MCRSRIDCHFDHDLEMDYERNNDEVSEDDGSYCYYACCHLANGETANVGHRGDRDDPFCKYDKEGSYKMMTYDLHVSTSNKVTTVSEFCFGVELHPTVLDIDLKHFVRSRITLVLWPLFVISAIFYQRNIYGRVSQSLMASGVVQMAYVMRIQWTENLALNSLDYKRANCGFYKLWSDMVMFPTLYCSSTAMLAYTQRSISLLSCCVLTVAAFFFIYLTTVIDKQKYDFRRSKGMIKIRGVDPYFISAKYRTETGDTSANLLLGSGYWATCRHPNYISEAATFVVFSAFQGFYPIYCHVPAAFVTGYLFVRLCNDESRCLVKYGQAWMQYCNKVPFRLIPGLY